MDHSNPLPPPARETLSRRQVVIAGAAAIGAAGAATVGTGAAEATTKVAGKRIGPARAVPVGSSALFADPKTHLPSLVIQLHRGKFVAYDAVCPHEGCTVGYVPQEHLIQCPCHGSQFNPATGRRVRGPAPHGLKKLTITVSGGQLFVKG
ncbi:MAG: ubiquinol-cytochrome c reductase iron-sulfur subunit [Acidimicrobiales bacterium]